MNIETMARLIDRLLINLEEADDKILQLEKRLEVEREMTQAIMEADNAGV